MLRIILALSIAMIASSAEAKVQGCYERVYERKILRKYKKQKITALRLQFGLNKSGNGAEADFDTIEAIFKGEKKYRTSYVECQPKDDRLICGVEADGGLFTVIEFEKGIRIFNQFDLRFGDEETGRTARPQDDQKMFTLFKVSDGRCEK